MSENKQFEDAVSYLLSRVWARVKWKKIGRDPLDVFQHRLAVAARQDTVSKALTKLCHGLSIQGVDTDPELIAKLDGVSDLVLEALRDRNQYFVLKAREFAMAYPCGAMPPTVTAFLGGGDE